MLKCKITYLEHQISQLPRVAVDTRTATGALNIHVDLNDQMIWIDSTRSTEYMNAVGTLGIGLDSAKCVCTLPNWSGYSIGLKFMDILIADLYIQLKQFEDEAGFITDDKIASVLSNEWYEMGDFAKLEYDDQLACGRQWMELHCLIDLRVTEVIYTGELYKWKFVYDPSSN